MHTWQEDPVRTLLEGLKSDPSRFQKTGGYERLRQVLEEGGSPVAVKELLRGNATFVGDVLWTVCELDDLGPYVDEAILHITDTDRGTAAYAIEIVLRAARSREHLSAVLHCLEVAPSALVEHAALVLAAQGLSRSREIFSLGGWDWAVLLIERLLNGSSETESAVQEMANDLRQDRVLVGLVIATAASEQTERAIEVLEQSGVGWIHDFAGQLREMFQHRWH